MDRQNKTCPDVSKHLSNVNLEHSSTVNMFSHFKTLLFSGNYYSEHMRYQQMHLTCVYSCKRIQYVKFTIHPSMLMALLIKLMETNYYSKI